MTWKFNISCSHKYSELFFFVSALNESVHLIQGIGGVAYGYKCDLADRENVYKVAKKTQDEVGNVSI